MPRRMSLPAADDLFGDRGGSPTEEGARVVAVPTTAEDDSTDGSGSGPGRGAEPAGRRPSGRVRHDEKVTVYLTSQELTELEQARLGLRSRYGVAVDRGRLVREAVALALSDLEDGGADSALVRRLVQE